MTWGGLNNALTSWRNGLMRRFPNKDTSTDGARADKLHGPNSEHQEDADGTVDAFDCDVNWFGSADQDGNAVEDRTSEAVKADFMADPRSRLWIHDREISNKNVQDGKVRVYTGPSPHDHHIHFEAIQALEDDGSPWAMPRTDALLRELNGEDDDMPLNEKDGQTVWKTDIIPNPKQRGDAKTNPATTAFFAVGDIWAQVYNLRDSLAAQGKSLLAAVQALSAKDQVDERALAAALAPGVAAAVVAALPADRDDITTAELQVAVAGALRELLAP